MKKKCGPCGGLALLAEGGRPFEPQGVQLLEWSKLDPFIHSGVQMAEGGNPMVAMAEYLKNMGARPSGGGTQAPQARGGVMSTIGAEVDPGMSAATDPRFAALDPRSRAIARINERLSQEGSISGAQNATASIMSRNLGKPGLSALAPRSYGEFSSYLKPRMARGGFVRFADGGEVGMSGDDGLLLGAGLAASRLRPRHINRAARPVMRALAKPVLGMEAVSNKPLTGRQSDARFDFARKMTPHPYADLPVHKGQGAWMSGEGDDAFMQHNPLYSQELPRKMGRLREDPDAMYYAGQMGENLEQEATPVNRFVPHLMNTPDEANAMMIPGVNNIRLRQLAERAGPDWVTAHRPGNKAMMFPLGGESLEAMATKLGVSPRYGRSDQDVDRVLLSRKPLGYESGTYSEVGAQPRNASYAARERQAVTPPSGDRIVDTFSRLRAKELSGAK